MMLKELHGWLWKFSLLWEFLPVTACESYGKCCHVVTVVWSRSLPEAAALLWNDGDNPDTPCWLPHTASLLRFRGTLPDTGARRQAAAPWGLPCSDVENMSDGPQGKRFPAGKNKSVFEGSVLVIVSYKKQWRVDITNAYAAHSVVINNNNNHFIAIMSVNWQLRFRTEWFCWNRLLPTCLANSGWHVQISERPTAVADTFRLAIRHLELFSVVLLLPSLCLKLV